jgi:hypothetical protein
MKRATSEVRRRLRFVPLFSLACASLALAACGGGDSTSPPPPEDEWATVESAPWSLGPDNEGYKCYVTHVASEQFITGFRLHSPSPIQGEVQLSMTETALPLGSMDCSIATQAGRLIYAASKGTQAIDFPSGKGVHIAAGSYLLLNVHLTNPTSTTVVDSTTIEGRVGTAADVTTPLTMFYAGSLNLQIPADNTPHVQTGGCTPETDEHLVALIPLMRDRGTHQRLQMIVGLDTTTVLDAAFDPLHVNYSVLGADLHDPAGGKLRVECTFVNTTAHTIEFGDSFDSETCFTGIYHYAADAASADIYSCANSQTPDFVHDDRGKRS